MGGNAISPKAGINPGHSHPFKPPVCGFFIGAIMNTAELKKLAEAATPGKRKEYAPEISHEIDEGYRYIEIGGGTVLRDWISKNDAAFIAACDPAAILKLLEINAGLVEALKKIRAIELKEFGADWEEIEEAQEIADAALAKAEGTQS